MWLKCTSQTNSEVQLKIFTQCHSVYHKSDLDSSETKTRTTRWLTTAYRVLRLDCVHVEGKKLSNVTPTGRSDHDQQHCYHHASKVKPKAATAVVKLLMMAVRTPETCWAVNKRQLINLRNCCISFVHLFELLQPFGFELYSTLLLCSYENVNIVESTYSFPK
jgi:hypothetical protein